MENIPEKAWDLSKKSFTRHGIFLEALLNVNGGTMKDIEEYSKRLTKKKTGIHYTALPAIINDFEKKGFVDRVQINNNDKKKVNIFLTPTGLKAAKYIMEASKALREIQPVPSKSKKEIIIVHVNFLKNKWKDKCGTRRTSPKSKK